MYPGALTQGPVPCRGMYPGALTQGPVPCRGTTRLVSHTAEEWNQTRTGVHLQQVQHLETAALEEQFITARSSTT